MTRELPPYQLVTLRGGPLDGLRRHALRGVSRGWFMEPWSNRTHEYRPDPAAPTVWRYVNKEGAP